MKQDRREWKDHSETSRNERRRNRRTDGTHQNLQKRDEAERQSVGSILKSSHFMAGPPRT
jgi:hypothetical protein